MEPDWINAVISASVDYLGGKTSNEHSGLWRDFELDGVSYGSIEWVTAFIAMQIGPNHEARQVAVQAVLALLGYTRPSGGWGYRADVPEDCDSTACVLLAAQAVGVTLSDSLRQRSARLILHHQQADGGFRTYGREAWSVIMADGRGDWFESEASVTANSIMALQVAGAADCPVIDRAKAYLMTTRSEGLWHSFWCKGFAYGADVDAFSSSMQSVVCWR